jgi:bacterial leucyl aminopeptidase
MDRLTGEMAFFDIGNTLASVTISPNGTRIERLTVYPYVPDVLGELRDRGTRLGIISDRGPFRAEDVNQALAAAGLLDFFEPELVIYGRKDSPRIFEQAVAQAGAPERVLFVGEDPNERAHALQAGLLVAPHPHLAVSVLERAALRYVRVTVPHGHAGEDWRAALRDLPLLPLHVTGESGTTVYAITTPAAAARLDDLGFWVDRLGAEGDPLTTDLYLLRDDRQLGSGFLTLDGNATELFDAGPAARAVLASTDEGLLVAVPAGSSVERFHFSGAQHGHNLKLVPTATLLEQIDAPLSLAEPRVSTAAITPAEKEILDSRIHPEQLAGHVDRYAGARPAGADGVVIRSRHIHHADNAAAVTALVADLERIGAGRVTVGRHRFMHEGRLLENVEGELPGSGPDGVVLITAHMDSTGARQPSYQPAVDEAPGADDDASGIAGVLAAAEAIVALDAAVARPRRTVRFVLFNAEEHGLVGSRAYARDQAVLGTPIVAVFQMDMIGFDVLPERTFELHAGFTPSPAVESRSLALAQMIGELVPQVSPSLPAPQLYPAGGEPDPAERRSDHYSFQLHGHTACLASEDLFAGPRSGAPPAEMNPDYHLPTDAAINPGYAADIARAVIAAAWVTATH